MKSITLFFSFLLLLSGCASDPQYAVQRPFLYEVSKNGHKGYLFGTIHIGVTSEDLPENFWPYFDKADVFAFESDDQGFQNQDKLLERILFRSTESEPIRSQIPAQDYANLRAIVAKKYPQAAEAILDKLTMVGAYMTLLELKGADETVHLSHGEYVRLSSKFMLDNSLIKRARKNQKEPIYLDAGKDEDVIECFFGNDAYYKQRILDTLNGSSSTLENYVEIQKLVKFYREGDVEGIQKASKYTFAMDKCLLDERNQNWVPMISSMIESYNSPMIAVGTAHIFVGANSLVQLLEKKGFQIRRVEVPLK